MEGADPSCTSALPIFCLYVNSQDFWNGNIEYIFEMRVILRIQLCFIFGVAEFMGIRECIKFNDLLPPNEFLSRRVELHLFSGNLLFFRRNCPNGMNFCPRGGLPFPTVSYA